METVKHYHLEKTQSSVNFVPDIPFRLLLGSDFKSFLGLRQKKPELL